MSLPNKTYVSVNWQVLLEVYYVRILYWYLKSNSVDKIFWLFAFH